MSSLKCEGAVKISSSGWICGHCRVIVWSWRKMRAKIFSSRRFFEVYLKTFPNAYTWLVCAMNGSREKEINLNQWSREFGSFMKAPPLFSGSGSAGFPSLSHRGRIQDPADIYPGDLEELKNPPGPSAFSVEVLTVRGAQNVSETWTCLWLLCWNPVRTLENIGLSKYNFCLGSGWAPHAKRCLRPKQVTTSNAGPVLSSV